MAQSDDIYEMHHKWMGQVDCLAYAAFHCSSLRALAVSMSFEEMKREPTDPVEMDGIESSMGKARLVTR